MFSHELEGQAVVAIPENESQVQPRAEFMPSAFQLPYAGTRMDMRVSEDGLCRRDRFADFAAFRGCVPANGRQQPSVDADILHESDFGSNLPLKRA